MVETYITPAILVGLILFVWRDLGGRINRLDDEIHRINELLDRHIEGHPGF